MLSREALNDSGALWSLLNWRTLTTYQKASLNARWKIESLLVWDKCCPGTGTMKGLRPSYEMVSLFCRENFAIADRSLKDIRQNQWGSAKPNGHPAEKPEELISWLIQISLPESGVVADWFMGSGTTGAAALKAGHRFIGIEQDEKWFNYSVERLKKLNAHLKKT
ncbi:MAG: site-specific DNA-methyltransferase [Planctomycetaceae bacterium]|jgi:site-specific DNA-methyltransferase (adenine-specific)|nr:site-specific DNA-methyltransferase [Planctomycetaceae bacterium]